MKLLVVGGGGREHAIIRSLKKNPDVETIYALPKHGAPNIIYHRFFGPLGTYPAWRRFRYSMRYNRKLTVKKIHTIAMRNGVQSFGTMRTPDLKGKKIKCENLKRKGKT